MQYLFHISDLHIGSSGKNASRLKEYKAVFDRALSHLWFDESEIIEGVRYTPTNTIVVITGDVFHFKTSYSGDDIYLFKYLLNKLKKYTIVMIAGNHDVNMKNEQAMDLITPIVDSYENIIYHKQTALFETNGVKFHHISMYETIASPCEDAEERILLYHGFVNGATFGTHIVNDAIITKDVYKQYKLTLLGDIHESQFMLPTVAYAGSLIQQTLGESKTKGIIIWDLLSRNGKFIQIHNDTVLVRLDLRGKSPEECNEIIKNETMPKHLLKLSVITDSNVPIAQIEQKFGKINSISQVSKVKLNPNNDIMDALKSMLESKNIPSEAKQDILAMHEKTLIVQKQNKWTITYLEWSNVLKYGPLSPKEDSSTNNVLSNLSNRINCTNNIRINKIDFTKLENGLSGVIGENCIGKSSIIDIIVYALFADLMRYTRDTFIHHNANESYIKIELMIEDTKYAIIRRDHRTTRRNNIVEFLRYIVAEDGTITTENAATTANSITEINQCIRTFIGTKEQFFATSLYQAGVDDILNSDSIKRLVLLSSLFGMPDYTHIIKPLSLERKNINDKLFNLIKPRYPNAVEDIPIKQAQLTKLREEHASNQQKIAKTSNIIATRSTIIIQAEIDKTMKLIETYIKDVESTKQAIKIDVAFANKVIITDAERLLSKNVTNHEDLTQKMAEIRQEQSKYERYQPSNPERTIESNKKAIGEIRNDKRNNVTYNDECLCCAKNKVIIAQLIGEVAFDKIKTYEDQNIRLQSEYDLKRISYNTYLEIELEYQKLFDSTKHAKQVTEAQTKIDNLYKYEQYLLGLKLRESSASLAKQKELIEVLQQELERARAYEIQKPMIVESKQLETKNVNILKTIGSLMEQILVLETDVKIAATYEQNRAELQAKYDKYKTYEECLKSHNLKLIAINKIMKTVVTNTNLLLSEVCSFTLNFEINETSMDIWIVEQSGLAVQLIGGSGFQKAIVSLCFRLTLTSLLSSTSMFMIMDEPLQFADKNSLAKVQEMLLNMHVVYKFVFIISHIDDIKEMLTYPLQIKSDGKSSYICNISENSNIIFNDGNSNIIIVEDDKKVKKETQKEKITCDVCNIEIQKTSYKSHLKSQAHISKL